MPRTNRKIYDPQARTEASRRFEWVALDEGEVCVWEMQVAETLRLVSAAMRPPDFPGNPIDETEAILWQIMLTCFDDEPPQGKRIFADHMAPEVTRLKHHEFRALMQAIGRLNGTGDRNLEGLNAFFARGPDERSPS
jgi:hypothetical protein